MLSLADSAMPITCGPDDPRKIKWDYCGAPPEAMVASLATIRAVDAGGKPLPVSFKGAHGLSEFCLVTVKGKVLAVDAKNLVVSPEAIHNAGEDGDGKKGGTPVAGK